MVEQENAAQRRNDMPSVLVLALRVLRGEITEDQAVALLQRGDGDVTSDG